MNIDSVYKNTQECVPIFTIFISSYDRHVAYRF